VNKTSTILILTDSLAFPRSEPEIVPYERTWVALLKRKFPEIDIVHCGRGGATIVDLYKHSTYFHGTIEPKLVLVQSGVVDCAPRALTVMEQQVLKRLPLIGSLILSLVRKNAALIRRWRRMSYTTLTSYEAWVNAFERLFSNVYWIEILPATTEYEVHVRGIGAAINSYNEVLQRRNYITTADFTHDDIMSDYHHLNINGHQRLADRLADTVQIVVVERNTSQDSNSVFGANLQASFLDASDK
jgi:lysophospholipase L1-like esterase